MKERELQDLYQWKLRQGSLLTEIDQLTGQLADAMGRGDQVSINMLLVMRDEPIKQATEVEESIRSYLPTLEEDSAIRGSELLRGAEAESEEEKPLAAQVAHNRRLLEKIREMDRTLSLRLGGHHSFYEKFRD